jgi:hypothetical protein
MRKVVRTKKTRQRPLIRRHVEAVDGWGLGKSNRKLLLLRCNKPDSRLTDGQTQVRLKLVSDARALFGSTWTIDATPVVKRRASVGEPEWDARDARERMHTHRWHGMQAPRDGKRKATLPIEEKNRELFQGLSTWRVILLHLKRRRERSVRRPTIAAAALMTSSTGRSR